MKYFLCDSAKSCISGLSHSSANYFEAIELLKQRYGNPKMLINAYMKRFVQLPVIKNNNDVFGLRKLYDQVESSVRNLKSLQMDTNKCNGRHHISICSFSKPKNSPQEPKCSHGSWSRFYLNNFSTRNNILMQTVRFQI